MYQSLCDPLFSLSLFFGELGAVEASKKRSALNEVRLVTCSPEGPLQQSQAKAAVQLITLCCSLKMDFHMYCHCVLDTFPTGFASEKADVLLTVGMSVCR